MMKNLGLGMLVVGMFFVVSVCASREALAQLQQAGAGVAADGKLIIDSLYLGDNVALKLVPIPAGKFLMGSPEKEDYFRDAVQHEVTISKPFYMGATHVTVDQFSAFVKDSGYKTEAEKDGFSHAIEVKASNDVKKVDGCSWHHPSFDQKGNHPVLHVSWNDAQAFCKWLSKKSGKTVSLPSESQWEYACRAGTKTLYPWGDNPDDGKGWANCRDRSCVKVLPYALALSFGWDDGFVFTSPVGSFRANTFGLYDMIGNAQQWCQDRYGNYGTDATTDPIGPDTGRARVLRGGSWLAVPSCGSARRSSDYPENRDDQIGFRVVVAADDDPASR